MGAAVRQLHDASAGVAFGFEHAFGAELAGKLQRRGRPVDGYDSRAHGGGDHDR